MPIKVILLFISMTSGPLFAAQIWTAFPEPINPEANYVFYSHGFIVEGTNPRPVNPRWGVYDFPAIKEALADDAYQLIAYHRPAGKPVTEHVQILVNDVQRLIEAGVKPEQISLVGFSRGGVISIRAVSELNNSGINLVIMASCFQGLLKQQELIITGRVLSIYETSDQPGSCQALIDRSKGVSNFKEVAISTGKEHGAFFLPRPDWLVPLKDWLKSSK